MVAEKFPESGPEAAQPVLRRGPRQRGAALRPRRARRRGGGVLQAARRAAVAGRGPRAHGLLRVAPAAPRLNGYDVAGRWMRHLLDTYGAAKVRKYYRACRCGRRSASTSRRSRRPGTRGSTRSAAARDAALLGARRAGRRAHPEATLTEAILGPRRDGRRSTRGAHAGDPARGRRQRRPPTPRPDGREERGRLVRSRASAQAARRRDRALHGGAAGGLLRRADPARHPTARRWCCAARARSSTTSGGSATTRASSSGRSRSTSCCGAAAAGDLWIDGELVAEAAVPTGPSLLGVGCVGGPARSRTSPCGASDRRLLRSATPDGATFL